MTELAGELMKSRTLLFRCDANPVIGIGHVMRCLALAQAWQAAGGRVLFAVSELPVGLETRLRSDGIDLIRVQRAADSVGHARSVIAIARHVDVHWIVIDGDSFGVDFLLTIADSGLRTLLIDDFASRESFPVELILNPNPGFSEQAYRQRDFRGRLLLGQSYIPLRREFVSAYRDRVFSKRAERVLVTLGGSDPENLAPRIVDALRKIAGLRLTVVAGASYEHWEELKQASAPNVEVLSNPSAIHELIHDSDLAVAGAGGTLWELLHVGCVVLSYSRNHVQAKVVDFVAQQGAAWNLGDTRAFDGAPLATAVELLAADGVLRERMANAGRLLIDGKGAERVVSVLLTTD
jgi:UDP-2,4-diacetamido-2,4,6-trideoxy-beta-L-altropyranose hydrolase